MRLLVTGATGYLGGVFRNHCGSLGIATETVGRNFSDQDILATFNTFQPTAVIHFASLFVSEHRSDQVVDLIRSNIEFGTRVLEAMKTFGCGRIVTAGSAWQDYEVACDF